MRWFWVTVDCRCLHQQWGIRNDRLFPCGLSPITDREHHKTLKRVTNGSQEGFLTEELIPRQNLNCQKMKAQQEAMKWPLRSNEGVVWHPWISHKEIRPLPQTAMRWVKCNLPKSVIHRNIGLLHFFFFFNFLKKLEYSWLIMLLSFRYTAKWFSYAHIYSFSNSFRIYV